MNSNTIVTLLLRGLATAHVQQDVQLSLTEFTVYPTITTYVSQRLLCGWAALSPVEAQEGGVRGQEPDVHTG